MGWISAGLEFASFSMDRPDYRGFRISACPDYRGSTVRQIFPITNKFLSRRIHWRKSGHFEDPDTSPDINLKSGRMVILPILIIQYNPGKSN
ncbi:hypothetical protein AVEN_168667-1 [Araneus ventricosus]|uniref:Uncharacterized protein n=1 Tax=Araneus ventricosus TaxID=182803 RepID=A0A4Y2LYE3_ARAVE|nr:hypothetical protein AVEN_168667-1 [Araneus ventricosus]